MTTRVLTRFSAGLARWPSFWLQVTQFRLDLEIIKTNILSKIHDDCFKNVTARVLTRFSADLARWPSFWLQVTQFWTWPRNHQDKHIEQDSWWLLQKLDLDLIEANILSKFHQDWVKTMTSGVLTSFSFDLTKWPSFWPQLTQYQTWPRFHRCKHSD